MNEEKWRKSKKRREKAFWKTSYHDPPLEGQNGYEGGKIWEVEITYASNQAQEKWENKR